MSKRILPKFVCLNETAHVKLKDKVVELIEEKHLMTRFIVASRSKEDIDLSFVVVFGNYKFSVVP